MLGPLYAFKPTHSILRKLLHHRPQPRLTQRPVVERSHAQQTDHERAADRAEVVRHVVARRRGVAARVPRELVLAADGAERGVLDAEERGEHGGGDFAAVGAVADVRVAYVGAFDGLAVKLEAGMVRLEELTSASCTLSQKQVAVVV